MQSNWQKMQTGQWYNCLDPELEERRILARRAVHQHNRLDPDARGAMAPELAALIPEIGQDVWFEAPFYCSYGFNIQLGDRVYLNAGCFLLDTAPIRIGDDAMLGPGVQIYCSDHHRDPVKRNAGFERALPVEIGAGVWIGGCAILLPGVQIGADAIIGAGSVVTHDVAPGETVVGNPARAR